MNEKRKLKLVSVLYLLVLFATIQRGFSAFSPHHNSKNQMKSKITSQFGSSVIFPVTGNVYPKGYYHVTLNIGHPPKPYFLDLDTGSDLTWIQCDAPCTKCIPAPHPLYKPKKDLVTCDDPLCALLHWPGSVRCETPEEQCDYVIEYADHGSSMGVLVQDIFPLEFSGGSTLTPRLAFGCGYNQEVSDTIRPPYTDGVLGLGNGKASILRQLHNQGLTRNVVGHCLSGRGGGFLFFGDDLLPSSGIIWTPMSSKSAEKHYSLGPADLQFGGQATGVIGLPLVFDSGSTYTYFNSQAYNALLSMIKNDLNGKQLKDANDERSLPVCWKGAKSFKSIRDVKNFFKPLVLSFTKPKNAQLQLSPEAYLIITDHGNVCLGILNGTEVGLENLNIIGGISLQDKVVIYDNEKQQIGWASANCDRLPKSVDRDSMRDFSQPHSADLGVLTGYYPATVASGKDL